MTTGHAVSKSFTRSFTPAKVSRYRYVSHVHSHLLPYAEVWRRAADVWSQFTSNSWCTGVLMLQARSEDDSKEF